MWWAEDNFRGWKCPQLRLLCCTAISSANEFVMGAKARCTAIFSADEPVCLHRWMQAKSHWPGGP